MGIRWTKNEVIPRLQELEPELFSAISATMEYYADVAEGFAKSNAPWNDRTGNARQGLNAKAFAEDEEFAIVVYHTAPYGVWLEVRWSGRYAILLPTVEHVGPQVMEALRSILGRL